MRHVFTLLFLSFFFCDLQAQSQASAGISVFVAKYVGTTYLDRYDFKYAGEGKSIEPNEVISFEIPETTSDFKAGAQIRFKVTSEPYAYSINTTNIRTVGDSSKQLVFADSVLLFTEEVKQNEQVYSIVAVTEPVHKKEQPEIFFPVVINVN